MSKREALVYGRRACLAVAEHRPESILRVLYDASGSSRDLAPLLKACAEQRKPYRAVDEEDLRRASGSTHHEGVLVVTHRPRKSNLEKILAQGPGQIWFALDGVANDHNLGAIARTLAWFGGGGLVWEGPRPQLSGAALRVAQGGAEVIELVAVEKLSRALEEFRRHGIQVIGADQNAKLSAFSIPLNRPTCWVLGSEQFGLSKVCQALCDELVSIPGSGQIESLNVSVSAGVLIAQSYAQLSAMR